MTCELPEAFRQVNRKAKKEHKCCECHRTIVKGAVYIYCSGIWDGSPASYKTCKRCDKVRTLTLKKYPPIFEDEGPAFGELMDYIREMGDIGNRKSKSRNWRTII